MSPLAAPHRRENGSFPPTIRPARPSDVPALARIFLRARRKAFHWCDPTCFQEADFAEQTCGEDIFLAEDTEGTALGFASVWMPDRFLHHLFVDPDHQRGGVGTLLLWHLHSVVPQPWKLKCLLANEPALAFYRGRGWVEAGRGIDPLGEYAVMCFQDPPAPASGDE